MYIYIFTSLYFLIYTYAKLRSRLCNVLPGLTPDHLAKNTKMKLEPPGSRNLPAFSRVLGVICDMSPKWGTWAKGP